MITTNPSATSHKRPAKPIQHGFTIIELLVATLVFSVILTVIAAGVMSFSKSYYHGVYVSATQNAARTIVDTVTQSMQFGGDASSTVTIAGDGRRYLCAGGYVFVFRQFTLYRKDDAGATGFYMQPLGGESCGIKAFSAADGGKQLLGDHMRIIKFTLSSSGKLHTVSLRVGYGDDTLFPSPNTENMQCMSGPGSEYCAVASLTATAQERK